MLVCDKCGARHGADNPADVKCEQVRVESTAIAMHTAVEHKATPLTGDRDLCRCCRDELTAIVKSAVDAFLKPPEPPRPPQPSRRFG